VLEGAIQVKSVGLYDKITTENQKKIWKSKNFLHKSSPKMEFERNLQLVKASRCQRER